MAANQTAINFLAGEVRMTRSQLKNLDDQVESYKAQREAAQYKLDALLAKLKELGGTEESGSPTESSRLQAGNVTAHLSISAAGVAGEGTVTPGVRSAIREALRAAPEGLNTRQILLSLPLRIARERYTARVPFPDRVRNELIKMRNEKQIYKRDGLYFLIEKQ